MFDEDTKKVVCYGTNDTYVMKGPYTGSFCSGANNMAKLLYRRENDELIETQ